MILSMTGFAAAKAQALGYAWAWEIRSVNGKGLDLRLRVPDWIDGLEALVRADLGRALQRGNVSLTLKVTRELGEAEALAINAVALAGCLQALGQVEQAAISQGLSLRQATTADVLLMRGVMEAAPVVADTVPLRRALLADLQGLLADFQAARAAEGTALAGVIAGQIDQMADLTARAAIEAASRRDTAPQALRDALARVLANTEGVDETRLAQELALAAVKQDVTEELDRLTAHVAAARALLADEGPVGRKLDFLMQEFMREANTLCSKAQSLALTRIGLDLKTVIDQMREQVQNVE